MFDQMNPVIPFNAAERNGDTCNTFTFAQRIEIGCVFNSGLSSAADISMKYHCHISYVYKLGRLARTFLNTYADQEEYANASGLIPITKQFVELSVVCLRTVCQASLEDSVRFVNMVYHYHISVSTASNICHKYGHIAFDWNQSIPLNNIRIGANDEIFFGRTQRQMILAGVDLKSTYIYCAMISSDRKAETWELLMRCCRDQGLSLNVSISDAGASLIKGVGDAFDGACFTQLDVFHSLRDLGDPISKLETRAYSLIEEMVRLEGVLNGPKPHQKTREKYALLSQEIDSILTLSDTLKTLKEMVRELLDFTGYSRRETESLLRWIVDEMKAAVMICKPLKCISVHKLLHAISTFEGRISKSLSFIDYLMISFDNTAEQFGVNPEAVRLVYRIRNVIPFSQEYMFMHRRIQRLLHNSTVSFDSLVQAVNSIVNASKKASSMIENVNSRLRTALNDSRGMSVYYLALLIMYLNTKDLRRSEIGERKGKSPYEMLTGETVAFLDILFPGYKWILPLWKSAAKRALAA